MARSKAGKSLVIVESPAKAKTINKYLGDDFVVKASMGHVRDLPESDLGIEIAQGFRPTYEIVRGRTKVISELRKLSADAPMVYLATDRDREGEAIAWHLQEALRLPEERTRRVIFNEITKTAIAEAFREPHNIDLDRVNAQQARRILDRIVGYELSPLLWRKIAKGLSAGRVQSVAVLLIVEREREIRAFVPQESWKISAYLTADATAAAGLRAAWMQLSADDARTQKDMQRWLLENGAVKVELAEVDGRTFSAQSAADARPIVEALGYSIDEVVEQEWKEYAHLGLKLCRLVGKLNPQSAPAFEVDDLTTKRTTTRPAAPFTTATLQQQASTQLRFAASRTMRVAQGLYEGVDLKGEGPVGLITYMRTDSTNLAGEALTAVRGHIQSSYGAAYLPDEPNFYGKRQARAQEAHEAIRPTDVSRTPDRLRDKLTDEQFRLYDLIWRRFVACQMTPAQWDATALSVRAASSAGVLRFSGNGRKLVFDGFMRVAGVSSEDQILPPLQVGQRLGLLGVEPRQHFTAPPARYTEASLVKTLEAEGIGRPSTYAAIIDTIQQRGYVEQEDRKFYPSALGELVTDKLVGHFPQIMNVKFTSYMEEELDKIEEAHLDWVKVLHEFYDPFKDALTTAGDEMEAAKAQPSDQRCPLCESAMVYRWSKNGRFLSCTNYPTCKGTVNVDRDGRPLVAKAAAVHCERCGKPMALKQSKTGFFLGCTGYPDCRSTLPSDENGVPLRQVPEEELTEPCEACGEGTLVVKWKRLSAFLGCDRYPKCKHTKPVPADIKVKKKPAPPPREAGVACDKCNRPMVVRVSKRGEFLSCSGFPRCRNAKPMDKLEELRARAPLAETHADGETDASPTAGKRGAKGGAVKAGELGAPPPGFAWTRTGRPVVEVLPEGDLACPECKKGVMELRRGRFGPFYSCGNFPRCKFVANLRGDAKKAAEELMPAPAKPKPVETEIPCTECGKPMLLREGRTGKFLGCSGYPKCRATQEAPAGLDISMAAASAE